MNQPRGFTAPVSARSPFVDSARVSYYASSHAMKEIFKSLTSVCRLAFVVVISAAGSSVMAQSPTPSPQDKRGLGIESNAATYSQSDRSKSKEAKPELVLQTGYSSFFGATRLVFSPDGRLLATGTFRSSTIKLWETATGRELRNLSTYSQRCLRTGCLSMSSSRWERGQSRRIQPLNELWILSVLRTLCGRGSPRSQRNIEAD